MTDAVKALGQQIGESMKSMQDQINQLAGSRMSQPSPPNNFVFHEGSQQAFASRNPGDGGDDDDDDDDDGSDDPDADESWHGQAQPLIVARRGSKTGAKEDHQGMTHQEGMVTHMVILCRVVLSLGMRTTSIGERICQTCQCRVFQGMLQPFGVGGTR